MATAAPTPQTRTAARSGVALTVQALRVGTDPTAARLREVVRSTRPGERALVAAFGDPRDAEFLTFCLGALRVAVPEVGPVPLAPPPPPFQLADPDHMRARLREAGLTEVRVEPLTWHVRFDSAQRLWDAVVRSIPVVASLAARLTRGQVTDIGQVLDGMLRERSGGVPAAVLRATVNVGTGWAPARGASGAGPP